MITIQSSQRNELIDITAQIEKNINKNSSSVTVYIPHTTAAVTINENADPTVKEDIQKKLNDLIPKDENYKHSEGNSDSHIKASLIGSSVTIPIIKGKLALGTWQGIFFCEFDGPRKRKVVIA